MSVVIVVGTRPEIIKMSPLMRELLRRDVAFAVVHTGQHYSRDLDEVFFRELELPDPKFKLVSGSGSHAEETGSMLVGIEAALMHEEPDVVLVEGDTNSVLAGVLAAVKLQIPVGHVEAGLRSFDRTMPEEVNRIVADHLSESLFAPTDVARDVLLGEGIPRTRVFVTGNTVVDAVRQNLELARARSRILAKLRLRPHEYLLLTVHRQENVDVPGRLESILESLVSVQKQQGLPIVWPLHPRAARRMREFGMEVPSGVIATQPLGFHDFLVLESEAAVVLTDSGGVQEESCILQVPCVTLRDNTERPETLDSGGNVLAGASCDSITKAVDRMRSVPRNWMNPFGDGHAAERIVDVITGVRMQSEEQL